MIAVEISPTPEAGPIVQDIEQSASYVWKIRQFVALVANDPTHRGVTWDVVQGGGSIDERGVFSPPCEPRERWGRGVSTLRATSITDPSKSATAIVRY